MGELELTTGFFPLAWILYFLKPSVSIDGSAPQQRDWGTEVIPLAPGQHKVTVWFKYFFIKQASLGEVVVDVPPGGQVKVKYRVPWLIMLPGKMTVTGPFAAAGAAAPDAAPPAEAPVAQAVGGSPASWLQDPTGRHELRYWDGGAWTANVSDQGTTANDPV